jgi:AcrR family transcriptional regulator
MTRLRFLQYHCINAVGLHLVADAVNTDRRAARRRDTEERLVAEATRLFVGQGYAATTLAQVAAAADVAPRTVYVRFGTKAALLSRAIGVALVGDHDDVGVTGRDWYTVALEAPTAAERIGAWAAAGRSLMERAGALLAVADEAEAVEPAVAADAHAGRLATRDAVRRFWVAMARDGLLLPGADVDWLADTSVLLVSTDGYRQVRRVLDWDPDRYETWLRSTFTRLAAAAATSD